MMFHYCFSSKAVPQRLQSCIRRATGKQMGWLRVPDALQKPSARLVLGERWRVVGGGRVHITHLLTPQRLQGEIVQCEQ